MLNLTPHVIVIRLANGEDLTLQPSGVVARIVMKETEVGSVNGIPLIVREAGEVVGIPTDGTICLVSSMVLDALPQDTKNVFAPDTGSTAVRNAFGQMVAVTRLVSKNNG